MTFSAQNCSCDNTAPRPKSEASVKITYVPSSFGKARIASVISLSFSVSNACPVETRGLLHETE